MHSSRAGGRARFAALGAVILLLGFGAVGFPQTSPAPTPAGNQPAGNQSPASLPTPPPAPAHPFLILIDPAHGGTESGAVLNPTLLEKDVTLAFARRLRQELGARGISVQLLREADGTFSADQRAAAANAAHAALYVAIHATSQGTGMRIYTAALALGEDERGPFVSWQEAQSASLARSRSVQQQMTASIQKTGFPLRALSAPLRPLNNLLIPALAIEIAPTTGDVSQLASADYQQMVSAAVANSIASIRGRLESAP